MKANFGRTVHLNGSVWPLLVLYISGLKLVGQLVGGPEIHKGCVLKIQPIYLVHTEVFLVFTALGHSF